MKLNVGCGSHYADGWVNTDVFQNDHIKPDHLVSVKGRYPFDDSTFDVVYMGHVLEHIEWEYVPNFLKEMSRISKPDALFMVVGPDMYRALDMWKNDEISIDLVSNILEHQDTNYQDSDTNNLRDGAPHFWNCHEKRVLNLLISLGFIDVTSQFETLILKNERYGNIDWPLVSGIQWQFALSFKNNKDVE